LAPDQSLNAEVCDEVYAGNCRTMGNRVMMATNAATVGVFKSCEKEGHP